MDDQNDIDLLLNCADAEGRKQLLGELLLKYEKRLRSMVKLRLDRRLQGRLEAADVIQETFLTAAEGLERYLQSPEAPFYLWLRFLAGRKLQEIHRRHLKIQRRDAHKEFSFSQISLPPASSDLIAKHFASHDTPPSKAAARKELKIRLHEALERMEPLDREVLALRHLEQLSNAEAALVLGLEEAALRQRYYRALGKLKKILTAMSGGKEEAWV